MYSFPDVQSKDKTLLTRQLDVYHPKQADIQLSRCTILANTYL